MSTVAIVGIGAMGGRIARRFMDAGHHVIVWNRTAARAERLVEAGAAVAGSPADAARRAEAVVTMVSDPEALAAVTEGSDGIAAGIGGSTTVIEMSTVGPAAIERVASVLPAGVGLLDAPVLGSLSEAESGRLLVFVGGPPRLAERWGPLLSDLGSVLIAGPLGAGAAAKLVANATLFGTLTLLGEVVALADGLGLDRRLTFDVLDSTPLGKVAERRRGPMQTGDYPVRFTLALGRKDIALITDAAAARGVDLRLLEAARTWFADAEAAGFGDADYSEVLTRIIGPR
jgi:3-hydroxyisobutyrate dehydrogenase-like beta-hydroxyacid dehydrogenase